MTIKKIALSAVAAALVSTTAFAAGTLTTKAFTMASELVAGQPDTVSVDVNATYKPELNAGITDGKLVINLTNATINDANVSDTYVYNKTQGMIVTASGTQDVANEGKKIIFDVNDSINAGDTLYLVEGTNGTTPSDDLNLTIAANAPSASMTMELVNNNDTTLDTSNSGTIMNIEPQFSATVEPFSNLIDASANFEKFTGDTTRDTGTIEINSNDNLTYATYINKLYIYVKPDNNVSTMGTFKFDISDNGIIVSTLPTYQASSYEYNTTLSNIGSDSIQANFDGNGTKIDPTTFTVTAKIDGVDGNSKYKKDLLSSANFGAWQVNGYDAQIPNVASTKDVDVTMKFTNESNIPADIFFTLIDPEGHTVSLSSKDYSQIASIPAKATGVYEASTLATLATEKNPNFDATGSFSVDVTIPTSPEKVYGMASFKNKILGQFKVLPIYSNGNHY